MCLIDIWFRYLIDNKIIILKDKDKVEYTIECQWLILLNLLFLLIISDVLGITRKTMLLMFFIYLLRAYTGGYHARTRTKCTVLSVISIIICSFIIDKIIIYMSYYSMLALVTPVLAILVYRISPRVSPNKPMSKEEIKRSKNVVALILVFDLLLYFMFMKIKIISATILVSLGLVYFLLVLDK